MENEVPIISLRINVPRTGFSFDAITDKWRIKTKKFAGKGIENLRKAVSNEADFRQKIAQPSIAKFPDSIRPNGVSKKGVPAAVFITNQKVNILKSAPKYFSNLDQMYATKSKVPAKAYKERVDRKHLNYLIGAAYFLPLTYAKYPKKDVIALALMAISSTKKIQSRFLKDTDAFYGSTLNIAGPENVGKFRIELNNGILKYGSKILLLLGNYENALVHFQEKDLSRLMESSAIALATDPGIKESYQGLTAIMKWGNEGLNKMVERYRTQDIAPFRSLAKSAPPGTNDIITSHIDFEIEEKLDETGKFKVDLFLDIKVRVAGTDQTDQSFVIV